MIIDGAAKRSAVPDMDKTYLIAGIPVTTTLGALTVDRVAAVLRESWPGYWKRCYTKHIDTPGNYYGFKAVAVAFASMLAQCEVDWRNRKPFISNAPVIASLLEKYDWPMYFVHAALLQSMMRTHPPQEMTWNDVNFPYDAVLFALPRGVLTTPEGKGIYIVGAAKFDKATLNV